MARHTDCPECQQEQRSFLGNGEGEADHMGLQEGDVLNHNARSNQTAIYNPFYTGRPRTPANGSKSTATIDRQEIIRRIKSGESRPTSPELERPASRSSRTKRRSPTPDQASTSYTREPAKPALSELVQSAEELGLQIERPGSAFHTGDFREKQSPGLGLSGLNGTISPLDSTPSLSTSPVAPWHHDFPRGALRQPWQSRAVHSTPPGLPAARPSRARAASNASLATSFVYKPPTSPLVQASRPDTPEPAFDRRSGSPDKDKRRHTFSPQSFQRFQSNLETTPPRHAWGAMPSFRHESTVPYQAHQPRRSLNSFASVPQSPANGSRRPSFSDSPLHLASMVGSYEESILRGRMSTTPSKPLNFVAQIGVLGKGDCKPNLRCPPHVTVPFPAVFYSYGSGNKGSAGDQPSPYVGHVDLENNLPAATPSPEKRRQKIQATMSSENSRTNSQALEDSSTSDIQAHTRRRQKRKQKRRSGSPKAPPGGSYRIPQQGQIQVVIKNPNKTAVKLFLIPYDLSDMQPGQKTFIRQRSYSAGPIIDMPLPSKASPSNGRSDAIPSSTGDVHGKPMLRYLVHLHLCCPSKGRYFLYKSIRVVFANRVPDGKEKLRNEIQLPEPRYSTYKPGRDSNVGLNSPRDGTRRRSVQDPALISGANDLAWPQHRYFLAQSLPLAEFNPDYTLPMQPMPFHMSTLPTLESRPASRQMSDGMDIDSERSNETQVPISPLTSPARHGESSFVRNANTLDEPFSFERDAGRERNANAAPSESLLSRRLKDLAFQAQSRGKGSS